VTKIGNDLNVFGQDLTEFRKSSQQDLREYGLVYLELLEEQRRAVRKLNEDESFDEELIRKYLSLIDLEETKLREMYS
jgi:monovalent cation/hydrogen antiporter